MKKSMLMRISLPGTVLFMCMVSLLHAQTSPNKLQQPVYNNIYEMLANVPGLDVTKGSGGKGYVVSVRGKGSLTLDTGPLYVVDGNVYGRSADNINPQEVESITVLKDAASSAAYGAQGAGGVIIITMKNGANRNAAAAPVESHTESAYTYFITHKTPLRVIGLADETLVEGVIQRQQDSTLVFIKKRKELLIPIAKIKKVEMLPADQ